MSFSTKLTMVLVGLPDIPLDKYFTSPPALSITPAMSRWSQDEHLVKLDKNPAAVQDPPPGVRDMLFRPARADFFILSLYVLQSGILHTLSPVTDPAEDNVSQSDDRLEKTPAAAVPSATLMAPVRVATSITSLGLRVSA